MNVCLLILCSRPPHLQDYWSGDLPDHVYVFLVARHPRIQGDQTSADLFSSLIDCEFYPGFLCGCWVSV